MIRRAPLKLFKGRVEPETSLVSVGKSPIGKGAFAARHFWPGDYVLKFGGDLLPKANYKNSDYILTIGPGRYLGPSGDLDDEANHSCDPNTQLIVRDQDNGHAILSAIKMILPGDEITYDYGVTLEKDDPWSMKCKCGSPLCRGVISS